jgi:large subunit ribosomal protein L10
MNREEKAHIMQSIRKIFDANEGIFLVGTKGLSVEDVDTLRGKLRKVGSSMRVIKNTLLKKVAQDFSWMNDLQESFKNQIALVYIEKEAQEAARILHETAKENEHVAIIAGTFNKTIMPKHAIEFLATIPSKEYVVARIIGALKAPVTRIAYVAQQCATVQQ